ENPWLRRKIPDCLSTHPPCAINGFNCVRSSVGPFSLARDDDNENDISVNRSFLVTLVNFSNTEARESRTTKEHLQVNRVSVEVRIFLYVGTKNVPNRLGVSCLPGVIEDRGPFCQCALSEGIVVKDQR